MPREGCQVGVFRIIRLQDGTIWLCHKDGEGMETNAADLEKAIAKFFKENF